MRRPRKLAELLLLSNNDILKKDDVVPSRYELELRECERNEKRMYRSIFLRKSTEELRKHCVCLDEDGNKCAYDFRAYFRKPTDKVKVTYAKWQVHRLDEHTCVGGGGRKERTPSMAYNSSQLLPIIMPLLGSKLNAVPSALKASLQEYVNVDLSDSMMTRLKTEAIVKKIGSGSDEIKYFPAYIAALKELGHKARASYANDNELTDMLVQRKKSSHQTLQKTLIKAKRTPFDAVAARAEVSHKVIKGKKYLVGWGVVFLPTLKAIDELIPVDFSDACHVKHTIGGTITNSVSIDSNHTILPLSYSWSVLNEGKKSWDEHNSLITESFGSSYDTNERRKIIDWDKGGVPSARAALEKGSIFSCGNHRRPHFASKASPSDAFLYQKNLHEKDPNVVMQNIQLMSHKGREYSEGVPLAEQYPIFAGGMHGHTNQAISESANNALALARKLDPCGELLSIHLLFGCALLPIFLLCLFCFRSLAFSTSCFILPCDCFLCKLRAFTDDGLFCNHQVLCILYATKPGQSMRKTRQQHTGTRRSSHPGPKKSLQKQCSSLIHTRITSKHSRMITCKPMLSPMLTQQRSTKPTSCLPRHTSAMNFAMLWLLMLRG